MKAAAIFDALAAGLARWSVALTLACVTLALALKMAVAGGFEVSGSLPASVAAAAFLTTAYAPRLNLRRLGGRSFRLPARRSALRGVSRASEARSPLLADR